MREAQPINAIGDRHASGGPGKPGPPETSSSPARFPATGVAGNLGADFVKCLAPALRAGTRLLTRLRSSLARRQASGHPPCSRVSAAIRAKN